VDVLAELEAMISGLSEAERAELDTLIADELSQPWLPTPGPQSNAFTSDADLLLYGGAAGGGKTDLLLGLALTQHERSVIFRRAYVDLRGVEERLIEINGGRDGYNASDMVYRRGGRLIECGALEKPGSELSWQGRAHDFIGFDEGAQLSAAKVGFVLGWLRSTTEGQRCRAVIASNPPIGGEGEWLIEWFAPWLDDKYPVPAKAGELRWCIRVSEKTVWVDGPGQTVVGDETYTHESRTFVPALLDDNPYLRDTGYRARIQNLPEPLRTKLLKGDFLAGRQDHEWQVIPSEWVRLANRRWEAAEKKHRRMLALAADVSGGGADDTILSPLHEDNWFAPLLAFSSGDLGDPTQIPSEIASLMMKHRRDVADLSADLTGGWGSGVRSHLTRDHKLECFAIIFSAASKLKSKDGLLGFKNLRAQMYWQFREALDPESGEDVKLPPDQRLFAELTTPRYLLRGTDILIEEKDEVKKRVGYSPDRADAVVMAWLRRKAAVRKGLAVGPRSTPAPPGASNTGWMG
jgi:hypothetical protein